MSALRDRLDIVAFGTAAPSTLALNARHIQAIHDARAAVFRAHDQGTVASPEILAVELRDALDALGAILGQVTPDDVLGRIFSSFCIGK
jgi:tRNA modification GTPase